MCTIITHLPIRSIYLNPVNLLTDHLDTYPTPININYFWSFGSLAGICLVIQIVSGVLLAMHYTPHVNYAFASVEHIMRDVNYGWLLRYLHANGASIFFIVVYLHFGRNLYFKSYEYQNIFVWTSGFIIFILMMATAFMGYVLPWGQMSFWGATVITNLFSAIPVFGNDIAIWLWGGFSVDNPTLNRFFSLHYCLPFVILGVMVLHLHFLHYSGSSDPLGLYKNEDLVSFYPYFYVKDLLGFLILCFIFSVLIFFYPNILGHPDNYIPANPLVTPAHLVPEWYFLPFYAILRSVPNKLGGFICMFYLIVSVYLLIILDHNSSKQNKTGPVGFFYIFLLLMYLGAQPMETPYIELSRIMTFLALFYWPYYYSNILEKE
ncbi:MAG: cytochrome b/b6 [Methanobacterium sp.]